LTEYVNVDKRVLEAILKEIKGLEELLNESRLSIPEKPAKEK